MAWDEIGGLPHALGIGSSVITSYTNPAGYDGDYDIGGIQFMSAATDDSPYQRQLAKVQKDQFDNSTHPGDNSLQGWWTRTQTDWSLGSGQEFMEPIDAEGVDRMFNASAGVDVFTVPGYVSCLPVATSERTIATASAPMIVPIPNGYVFAAGTTVTKVVSGTPSSLTAAGTVTGIVLAGPNLLVLSSGKIEWVSLSTWAALATGWTSTITALRAWWVKSRILIAVGNKIFENAGSTITGSTNLDTATAVYTLQDSSSSVVGMATTPKTILMAVNTNSGASLQALTLDTAGTLPTTTAPITVAEFPPGETLIDIASYLGTYLGVSSSLGIRVAIITDAGGVQYGPLLGSPVASVSGATFMMFDRFLHYPVANAGDGRGGLIRVDLSEIDKAGRAAWSTFTRVPTGWSAYGCVVTGDRDVWMAASNGSSTAAVYRAQDSNGVEAGWLLGSKVRYGTLETKMFDSVKVQVSRPMNGSITVSVVDSEDTSTSVATVVDGMGADVTLRLNMRRAYSFAALRFDLTPTSSTGPSLGAWSMRSYPSVESRGEQVLIPLMNFDLEKSQHGVTFGYEGRAWERWCAIRDLLSPGVPVLVQELNSGGSYTAIADDVSFSQTAPPERASGYGGIVSLILRTL